MRMIQRYATRSGGILSFPPAPRFEIFRMRRMHREIQREPEDFGVTHKPHAKEEGDRNHDPQCKRRVPDSEQVIEDRPGPERRQNREAITDDHMGKEVAAFPHEKISAAWTPHRTIKIAVKQLS